MNNETTEGARKLAEIGRAVASQRIGEPFTTTIFGSALAAKILGGIAISAAVSVGTLGHGRLLDALRGRKGAGC